MGDLSILIGGHSPLLASAALGIGLLCLAATFRLLASARALCGRSRRSLVLLAAICCGTVVWVVHALALLSFIPPGLVEFEIPVMLSSLVIDLAGIAIGFSCVLSARLWLRAAGGLITGALMALTSWAIADFIAADSLAPSGAAVAVSAGVAAGLCVVTCLVTGPNVRRRLAAVAMFGVTLLVVHLMTVGAMAGLPGYLDAPGRGQGSSPVIATILICGALLFLAVTLAYDYRLAAREQAEVRRFRCLANASFEAILVHRAGELVDANDRFLAMFRLDRAKLDGARLYDLLPTTAVEQCLASTGSESALEVEVETPGGRLPMEMLSRAFDEEGTTAIALRDLSERREAEARIVHLAHHDPLTGLLNRSALQERISAAIAARRPAEALALVVVDLDGLKQVNDACGHETGDRLLVAVGARLQAVAARADGVARLGGDEFAFLAVGAGPVVAERLAKRLLAEIARIPVDFGGQHAFVTACAGIAVSPEDGGVADVLLRNADLALFRAKRSGRGAQCRYAPDMDEEMRERHAMEMDLREAVARKGLALHYQPQHDVATEALVGFEALARWRHPRWGQVPPDRFIPLAEETGLILPIGEWVLETACREALKWPDGARVAVNLSAAQFHHGDPAALVSKVLARTGLAPERLEVEITETVLLERPQEVRRALREMRSLGVRLALDDFGAGHSSLRYLHEFEFDRLKIDRAFISGMLASEQAAAIVKAILSMSASLGLAVTAEGVETRGQLEFLRGEGCGEAQGFLFGAAAPADKLFGDPDRWEVA